MKINKYLILILSTLVTKFGYAQSGGATPPPNEAIDGRIGNIITTAVPFLLISPDARAGAMGETGVATLPDVNATHWNPSKLAFLTDKYGFSASYSPWLQRLVPDINMAYLNGFFRLDERNVIGGSLRYFSYGDIQLTDGTGTQIGLYNPNELAIDASLARSFGENFSLGTALRFVFSNISNNGIVDGSQNRAATGLAADISAYYKSDRRPMFGKEATLAAGLNISNIGTKMSYSDNAPGIFMPTNLRLGGASTIHLDEYSDFTVSLDINKLLVPSEPNSTKSVPAGIFGSFNDAQGGFSEELQEIIYSTGLEYWYNKQFALRAGYFYENPNKGNRSYLTLGAGLKYNIVNIDFSYVLANQQRSPMANTLRFSLSLNFGESGAAK
ncbi:hypothetical protein PBAC_24770 [Pedobacter glucosidilyticus]|nr:type IX secretion system outer membrane channel protein PorV [Pedobacter glucosidilyticus]KHJ37312.1 hypothetical protein PBAC_24770 [Pedobacter glucosidilyticus]